MQELLADFLPYVFAFFLLDAVANVRRHHLLLAAELGRFQLRGFGLQLVGLAPGAEVIALDALPLLIGSKGVWRLDPKLPYAPSLLDPAELELVAFDSLGTLELENKKVLRNGKLFLKTPSSSRAEQLATLLDRLRREAPEQRMAVLRDEVRSSFDLKPVQTLRDATRVFGPYLSAFAWAFAIGLFALLPITVFEADRTPLVMERVLLTLGMLLVGLLVVSGMLLHRSGVKAGAMSGPLTQLLLLPFLAAHPLPHLTRDLYGRFHWAAVAAATLDRADFLVVARQELHRIALSRALGTDAGLDEFWDAQRAGWEHLLGQLGTSAAEVLAAQPRAHAGSEQYCPLCSSEFLGGVASCHDCGVALLPFAASSAKEPVAQRTGT